MRTSRPLAGITRMVFVAVVKAVAWNALLHMRTGVAGDAADSPMSCWCGLSCVCVCFVFLHRRSWARQRKRPQADMMRCGVVRVYLCMGRRSLQNPCWRKRSLWPVVARKDGLSTGRIGVNRCSLAVVPWLEPRGAGRLGISPGASPMFGLSRRVLGVVCFPKGPLCWVLAT